MQCGVHRFEFSFAISGSDHVDAAVVLRQVFGTPHFEPKQVRKQRTIDSFVRDDRDAQACVLAYQLFDWRQNPVQNILVGLPTEISVGA